MAPELSEDAELTTKALLRGSDQALACSILSIHSTPSPPQSALLAAVAESALPYPLSIAEQERRDAANKPCQTCKMRRRAKDEQTEQAGRPVELALGRIRQKRRVRKRLPYPTADLESIHIPHPSEGYIGPSNATSSSATNAPPDSTLACWPNLQPGDVASFSSVRISHKHDPIAGAETRPSHVFHSAGILFRWLGAFGETGGRRESRAP